ncbi:hypothetical protein B0H14DRAFT_2590712 [Mycena olivaceomarginata]|nr:hypothetical protein B0H14DRAFT_2590712 [Mycena olivaceomarginata]
MYFSYEWPSIDHRQVSSQTCSAISELVKTNEHRGYLPALPETPQCVRIRRELDVVVIGRKNRVKKRVFKAQNLDDTMKANIEVISRFLRAARRDEREQFAFPDGPALLGSLHAVRKALNAVETMARGDEVEDPDATEPDSDEDADTTKVEP